jgi:hypothetical protein
MSLSDTVTDRERASGNAERHRWPEMQTFGREDPALSRLRVRHSQ